MFLNEMVKIPNPTIQKVGLFFFLAVLLLIASPAYAVKICPKCGREYSDDANYCTQCVPPVKLMSKEPTSPVTKPQPRPKPRPRPKPVLREIIPRIEVSGDTVEITSVPSGVEVYWDGRFEGYTPLIITEATAGNHEVRLVLPGYKESVTTITISFSIMRIFTQSVNQFLLKNFSTAARGFKTCLESAPVFQYADSVRWLLAECYYYRKLYDSAIMSYNNLITKYPKSRYTPAALYRIALSYINIYSPNVAKNFLKKILSDYPNSPYADRAKAKLNELKDEISASIVIKGTTAWITTKPGNVDVFVDNLYIGRTQGEKPLKIRLKPGVHNIIYQPPKELSEDYRMTRDSLLIPIPKGRGPSPFLCAIAGGMLNALLPGLGEVAFGSKLSFFTVTTYLAGGSYLIDYKQKKGKNFFTWKNEQNYNQIMKYELYLTGGAYACDIISGFVAGHRWAQRKRRMME